MLPVCVVVTDDLCIADNYRPAAERLGIYTFKNDVIPARADPDAVNRLGVRLSIIASDVVRFIPLKAFRPICIDGICIYYRKTCDDGAKRCDYSVGQQALPANNIDGQPSIEPGGFSISYASKAALKVAENSMYLVVGRANPAHIPLAQLKIDP